MIRSDRRLPICVQTAEWNGGGVKWSWVCERHQLSDPDALACPVALWDRLPLMGMIYSYVSVNKTKNMKTIENYEISHGLLENESKHLTGCC